MNKLPTVAITGANGFLGSVLSLYFSEKGWKVVGLVRDPKKYEKKANNNVQYRKYDLTKPIPKSTFKDIDYVIHAAYVTYNDNKNAKFININAAKNLIDASQSVRKRVFISSMSAHENATSIYGIQKFEIEDLFIRENNICIRPGLIIGNGGIVHKMTQFMKKFHAVPLVNGGNQPLQIVYVEDLASAIFASLNKKIDGVITVATTKVYSYKEFYSALSRKLEIRVFFIPIPASILIYILRTLAVFSIKFGIDEDNVRGLQKLKSTDTEEDLKMLNITLSSLNSSLDKSNIL